MKKKLDNFSAFIFAAGKIKKLTIDDFIASV